MLRDIVNGGYDKQSGRSIVRIIRLYCIINPRIDNGMRLSLKQGFNYLD